MGTQFFHGALCHPPVLSIVLGHEAQPIEASLSGHQVCWGEEHAFPILVRDPAALHQVQGVALRDLTEHDQNRIAYFHGCFGQIMGEVTISIGAQRQKASAYFGPDTSPTAAGHGDFAIWQARFGDTLVATAKDIMHGFGQVAPNVMQDRQASLLVRGASRARAETGAGDAACSVRRFAQPQDVLVSAIASPYANFFAVEEYDLSFRRFDGTDSASIKRAAFISGDAVTVLPYDPKRDRVLLVEQFRTGPLARGDHQPWQLEAIAGRIDPGESPEAAARREASEEAALTLGDLLQVAQYYPSPGAFSEYIFSYVALADLPDGAAGVFGVEEEAEDIRGHLMGFDALMSLITQGEVANAPLILTALWLQRERARLRG